jgi:hypothetical protein
MTLKSIETKQRKIARTLQTLVHPDNPLAHQMTVRYRELEELKTKTK